MIIATMRKAIAAGVTTAAATAASAAKDGDVTGPEAISVAVAFVVGFGAAYLVSNEKGTIEMGGEEGHGEPEVDA